ncbi:hypothetical protein [Actinoplanes sp. TFC3]|uniref:hypothetical protein n=1 Tax=Actinoplanes sp. TFC3 TaxID=1710355 RepID=UPI000832717F|nr:hypothetical protein [Actinoplanes sp. TFC3]
MPNPETGWNLTNVDECLDRWEQVCAPADDLRRLVVAALLSRMDDPYDGARREFGDEPSLWFWMVPGSLHAGQAVYMSFMVFERLGTVRIDSIMTLSWPA